LLTLESGKWDWQSSSSEFSLSAISSSSEFICFSSSTFNRLVRNWIDEKQKNRKKNYHISIEIIMVLIWVFPFCIAEANPCGFVQRCARFSTHRNVWLHKRGTHVLDIYRITCADRWMNIIKNSKGVITERVKINWMKLCMFFKETFVFELL
jgi:hypothetical protein